MKGDYVIYGQSYIKLFVLTSVWLLTVCAVYLPCAQCIYRVHSVFTVCTSQLPRVIGLLCKVLF